MVKCTHKGCGKEFNEQDNENNSCQFHAGAPVFHEGLKGWSCCKKRVDDFDEFLNLPGCTFGSHSSEPIAPAPAPASKPACTPDAPVASHITEDGKEVYGKPAPAPAPVSAANAKTTTTTVDTPVKEEKEPEIEEDDESVPVPEGTTCKRKGCGHVWKDQATSRGSSAEAVCHYHSGSPVFHEGSKGWSCCTRKVLDFDEFLKIQGCKEGRHLFVGSSNPSEELVDCRTDWYQTQTNVIFSIFAKNREKVEIDIKDDVIDVDIKMKGNKRYKKRFELSGKIDCENSKKFELTTKVEINLRKGSGISWSSFEASETPLGQVTFGVTGGSGTVGGKEMYYNPDRDY